MNSSIQLFTTCIIEAVRPQAGMAVVNLLERFGVEVQYPKGQTCCGQPAYNAGMWDDARAMARHTIDVLSRSDVPIVMPSGSCADMIVHHYPEILASDPKYGSLAESIASRTYEFSQFVVDVLYTDVPPGGDVPPERLYDAPEHRRVAYHPSCHLLRGLGVTKAPRKLLAQVENIEVVDLHGVEECCGFGGLFAVKMSDISGAMLKRKLDAIENSGAQVVVGCDVSCLLHIGGGLHRRGSKIETCHLAELLANR